MSHQALLTSSCLIRHRTDTNDANGDVVTTEAVSGPFPCHAYQYFAREETDGQVIGREDMVVHLPAGTAVANGDRLDITWPSGRVITAEATGPPAERVNARFGTVHHVEIRVRETQ
jgi:hypothetical protein